MQNILNRLALVLLSLTAAASTATGGEVTADDWAKLHSAIRGESWTDAVSMSLDLLARLPESADVERARIRYMYLFALSGSVMAGELTHDEFAGRLEPFIGERVILPGHPVADPATNGPMLNQIAKTDSDDMVMVIAANSDASTIHCFEYAELREPVDLAAHRDDVGFIDGRLARIEPNASGSDLWVARVYFDEASVAFVSRH